jgi:drug/metabolite transporter (DMT)-like permease
VSQGFWFGLLAAFCWAAVDLLGAYAGRRVGVRAVTVGSLTAGSAIAVGLALVLRPPMPTDPRVLVELILLGGPFAVISLTIFHALKVGPVAVVSPIMSAYGVCAALFAVIFLGEHPHALQGLAIPLAGFGTFLCAFVFDGTRRRPRLVGRGPVLALVALLLGASFTVLLKYPVRHSDWLTAVLLLKVCAAIVAGVAFFVTRRLSPNGLQIAALSQRALPGGTVTWSRGPAIPFLAIALIAALDTVGLASFALGLTSSDAWLVAMVASTSPVVVVIGAILLYREKLHRSQWAGAAVVAVALAVMNST